MSAPNFSALGPDPALEPAPDYSIILTPEMLADMMAERSDAAGNITRPARSEEEVYEGLTQIWKTRHDAKVAKWAADRQQIIDDWKAEIERQEAAIPASEKKLKVPEVPRGVGRSAGIPEIASPYVMAKIRKREEPEMAYFLPRWMQTYATSGLINESKTSLVLEGTSLSLSTSASGKMDVPSNAALTWVQWETAIPNFAKAMRLEGYGNSSCNAWLELVVLLPHAAKKYMDHHIFTKQEVICQWLCNHLRAFYTMIRAYNASPDNAELWDPAIVTDASLQAVHDDLMQQRSSAAL